MKRSILFSLMVIGAIAAVVSAGSYAAFTDDATATGSISAATIDVLLNGDSDDDVTATFALNNLLPGESTTATVSVKNNGNRDIHVTTSSSVTETADPGSDCSASPTVDSVTFTDSATDDHSGNVHIADGVTETATITISLGSGVGNECQGNSWDVVVTFTGTGVADGS
jgi:predicted ribosomally synthesized peptide with SipW-like signal peptide